VNCSTAAPGPAAPKLGSAIFESIEVFYHQHHRHSGLGYRTPIEFEALHTDAVTAA
jgi:hypothetical protein